MRAFHNTTEKEHAAQTYILLFRNCETWNIECVWKTFLRDSFTWETRTKGISLLYLHLWCLCIDKHTPATSASASRNLVFIPFIPCRTKYSSIVGRNMRGERTSRHSWWVSFPMQRRWTPLQHLERMWKTLLANVSLNTWEIRESKWFGETCFYQRLTCVQQ